MRRSNKIFIDEEDSREKISFIRVEIEENDWDYEESRVLL